MDVLRKVEDILASRKFRIVKEIGDSITFTIFDNQTPISWIYLQITDGTVMTGKTRSSKPVDVDVINVSWLNTDKKYTGGKLGMLILIYALCDLKVGNPNIEYATLDDDSDQSTSITRNMYTKIGFSFRDGVSIGNNALEISGPEKQLKLNNEFIRRVTRLLSQIGTKTRKLRKSRTVF